jgi:hypothetical protein
MISSNTRIRKHVLIFLLTVIGIAVLIVLLISPVAKYLVEKYDVRYLGREIKVDWVYVNPFTGYIALHNPQVYESGKDTVFFSAKCVGADFALLKMFSRTYEITELNVEEPVGFVIQKQKDLNFNDIIERFRPEDLGNAPVHLNILHIKITNGEFHYREKIIPINYFVKKVNIESLGIRWNADTIAAVFSFEAGSGTGIVKGNFTVNTRNLDYHFATDIHDFDLELIRQYLWELINYGMFRAQLDANIQARGNFQHVDSIALKGRLTINDFHLGKTTTEDYMSFKRLSLIADALSPRNNQYLFDSLVLDDPFISYERFDSLDNVQAMFGKAGSNISDVTQQAGRFNLVIQISRYLKTLAGKFFESQYRINSLSVNNGKLQFSDYALSEKFSIMANALYIKADSISKTNSRVKFHLRSEIYPYGNLSASLSINPLDSGDLDLKYEVQKVPVTVFNPYIINYTSFPLDKGTLALNGAWRVRQGIIKSTNSVILIDPRVADRLKNEETKWLPLPLIMTLVRERGNIISYQIPITGNMRDPKLHLRDVITDLVENMFIKPPTIPYGIKVRKLEKEIEQSLTVTWKVHQFEPERSQRKFLRKMASFLGEHKTGFIDVYVDSYAVKERERILFFEARKKYFLRINHKTEATFTIKDSIRVERLSVKNLGHYFVKNLTKITRDTTMFTIQDKCLYFVGIQTVDRKYNQLIKSRETALRSFFISNNTENQIKMHKDKGDVPYGGFSCYKIKYNGDMPISLQVSYAKMHELNKNAFRRKYFSRQ